jgi:hypothetical protein
MRCNIRVRFNLVDVRHEVHFKRFLGRLSVIQSGTHVQDGEQNQSNVVGDKGGGDPVSSDEDCPPTQLQAKL